MAVYVDDVRHKFGRMFMCHMWADDLGELIQFAERIGVNLKWLQQPPKASWVHFDISLGKKKLALQRGAVLTDRYGPTEFVALQRCDFRMLARVQIVRDMAARDKFRESFSPDR